MSETLTEARLDISDDRSTTFTCRDPIQQKTSAPEKRYRDYIRRPKSVNQEVTVCRMSVERSETNSESHEVELNLSVALFRRPQVQGRSRDLVHHRHSQPVDRHVNGFEVVFTGVARLDAHRGDPLGGVPWKLFVVHFAAGRDTEFCETPIPTGKASTRAVACRRRPPAGSRQVAGRTDSSGTCYRRRSVPARVDQTAQAVPPGAGAALGRRTELPSSGGRLALNHFSSISRISGPDVSCSRRASSASFGGPYFRTTATKSGNLRAASSRFRASRSPAFSADEVSSGTRIPS